MPFIGMLLILLGVYGGWRSIKISEDEEALALCFAVFGGLSFAAGGVVLAMWALS